jgi:hypothetical protein
MDSYCKVTNLQRSSAVTRDKNNKN